MDERDQLSSHLGQKDGTQEAVLQDEGPEMDIVTGPSVAVLHPVGQDPKPSAPPKKPAILFRESTAYPHVLVGLSIPENGKRSVVISSHITDDIARTADYVTFLDKGKIVRSSAIDELLSSWKRIHYKDGSLNSNLVDKLLNRKEHMFGKSGVTDDFLGIKDRLAEGEAAGDVKVENIGLDDILIAIVKGDES